MNILWNYFLDQRGDEVDLKNNSKKLRKAIKMIRPGKKKKAVAVFIFVDFFTTTTFFSVECKPARRKKEPDVVILTPKINTTGNRGEKKQRERNFKKQRGVFFVFCSVPRNFLFLEQPQNPEFSPCVFFLVSMVSTANKKKRKKREAVEKFFLLRSFNQCK